jgi:hypothetical protein
MVRMRIEQCPLLIVSTSVIYDHLWRKADRLVYEFVE